MNEGSIESREFEKDQIRSDRRTVDRSFLPAFRETFRMIGVKVSEEEELVVILVARPSVHTEKKVIFSNFS